MCRRISKSWSHHIRTYVVGYPYLFLLETFFLAYPITDSPKPFCSSFIYIFAKFVLYFLFS